MRRTLLLVSLVAALLLAGCASESSADSTQPASVPKGPGAEPTSLPRVDAAPDEASDAADGPWMHVQVWNGSFTEVRAGVNAGVAAYCCPGVSVSPEGDRYDFRPAENLTAILVELRWQGSFDLDLWLRAPDHDATLPRLNGTDVQSSTGHSSGDFEGNTGVTTNHARILVVDPEALALPGQWRAEVMSKSSVQQDFTAAVSLFYGALPSEAYTALG